MQVPVEPALDVVLLVVEVVLALVDDVEAFVEVEVDVDFVLVASVVAVVDAFVDEATEVWAAPQVNTVGPGMVYEVTVG